MKFVTTFRFFAVALGLTASDPSAHAHDPFEATVLCRLTNESFVVRITLASTTAVKLCASAGGERRRFVPDEFELMRPVFESCARNLAVLAHGPEKLAPGAVDARLTPDDDIESDIVFPRPAAGPWRIDAAFLHTLGEGYGGSLVVLHGNTVLGHKRVQSETGTDADFVVPVLRKSSASAGAPARPTAMARAHSGSNDHQKSAPSGFSAGSPVP